MTFPLIMLGGLLYIMFLMHLQEISSFVKTTFRCKKKQIRKSSKMPIKMSSGASAQPSQESYVFTGMVKVVFFFYQMVALVTVEENMLKEKLKNELENEFFRIIRRVHTAVIHTMNFQIRFLCPFKALTPVKKQIFISSFPIALLLWLLILLICCSCLKQLRKVYRSNAEKIKDDKERKPNQTTFKERLLSCLLNIILLTYGTIAKAALALLKCVQIDQNWVLFIDGTVGCYNMWQYAVMAFVCIFVLPLPVGLHFAATKLNNRSITVSGFFLRLFLPICSIYDVCKVFRESAKAIELYQTDKHKSCNTRNTQTRSEVTYPSTTSDSLLEPHSRYAEVLLNVICKPFSNEEKNYQFNWESILILRRLVFILMFIFIPHSTTRILAMLILCIIMLIHSLYARAFTSSFVNICEIGFLFILATLSSTNLLKAFIEESNAHLDGYLEALPIAFEWTDVVLVDMLPIFTFATVVVLLCYGILLLLVKITYAAVNCIFGGSKRGRKEGLVRYDDPCQHRLHSAETAPEDLLN